LDGYIKLHRRVMESAVFDNPVLFKVWVWCMMRAAYTAHEVVLGQNKVDLLPGQFIFGRRTCAEQLNINQSSLYRYLQLLESMGNLNIKSNNRFSVVTIVNWCLYQGDGQQSEQQSEQRQNSKRTTNDTAGEQRENTNKKDNKGKKGKKEKNPSVDQLLALLDGWELEGEIRDALAEFVQYRSACAPLTLLALTKARDRLMELSGGDGAMARAIVNQSIMSGWKGLFAVRDAAMPAPKGGQYERL